MFCPLSSGIRGVAEDCKQLIESPCNVFLHFVKWSLNCVAQYMVRASHLYADCIFMESNVPADALSIVEIDLVQLNENFAVLKKYKKDPHTVQNST